MVEYLWKIMFLFSERNFYPHCIHVVLNAFVGCFTKNFEQGPSFKEGKQVQSIFRRNKCQIKIVIVLTKAQRAQNCSIRFFFGKRKMYIGIPNISTKQLDTLTYFYLTIMFK